jgi:hypothetical protein
MQEFLPLVHLVQDLLELEPQPEPHLLEIFFSFRMRLNNS